MYDKAGVLQGNIRGFFQCLHYAYDIPVVGNTRVATFANNTDFIVEVQSITEEFLICMQKWKIKLCESKSALVNSMKMTRESNLFNLQL